MRRFLITQLRIIRNGIQNTIRNASLAIAAMAVMVITLTIILFSLIANATFANTIEQITEKIDVSVYLKDDVAESQKDELLKDLSELPNVRSIKYVSKEEALEQYKEQNKDKVNIILAISQTDENPIPATIIIKPYDPNRINEIKDYLEQGDIKRLQSEETSYSGEQKEAIDEITHATTFFRQAGVVSVIVFAITSMLIIFNTIRMAIFNRRDELTIMRLLGANSWFIRGPFVVETIIYGVFSGIISVVLVNAVFSVASNSLNAKTVGLLNIEYSDAYFAVHYWQILLLQLGLGILIGAVSSIVATRRYLKFKSSK